MLTMLISLFTAMEEGLSYFAIASNYSSHPAQMVQSIQSVLASKYESRNSEASDELQSDTEELEMVAA